jgi:hypothetical protein
VPYAVQLLTSAAEELDGEHRTRALTELALARFRLNDVAGIGECAARIQQTADHNDPEQRMLSDFTRGLAATLGGDLAAGQVLLKDVTEQISRPPVRDDPRSLLFLALASGFLGDPRLAMAVGTHQLTQARNRGAVGVLVPALALFAAGRAWLGDHAGAFADAGEASELGDHLGYAADTAVAVEMLAWQSAARRLHEDARISLKRAKSLTNRAETTGFAAHQALTAAFCALCRADPAVSVSLLEDRIAADGGVGLWASHSASLPISSRHTSRSDDMTMPSRWLSSSRPSPRRRHRRGCGRWWNDVGGSPPPTTKPQYRRTRPRSPPMPTHRIPSRPPAPKLMYGARLRRSGQRVKAREQLRTAHEAFEEMDLTAWVLHAADELAATGAKPRTRRPQATEPLTSQETRVALHAAKGRHAQ